MLVPGGSVEEGGKEPWKDQLDSTEPVGLCSNSALLCDPGQVPFPLLSLSFLACKVGR